MGVAGLYSDCAGRPGCAALPMGPATDGRRLSPPDRATPQDRPADESRRAERHGVVASRPVLPCRMLRPRTRRPARPGSAGTAPIKARSPRARRPPGQDSPCSHPAEWDPGRSPGRAVTSPTRPSPARRRHRSLSSPVAGPRAPSGVEARRSGAAAIAGSPSGEPATGRGHTPPPSATGTLPGGQGHGRVKRIRSGVTPSFRTPAALTPRQVMRRVAVCALPQVRRSSSTAPLPRAAIVSSGVSRT